MALAYRGAYEYNDLGRHPTVAQHDTVFGASLPTYELVPHVYLFVTHVASTITQTWVRKYNLSGGDPVESILLNTRLTDWVDGVAVLDGQGNFFFILARENIRARVTREMLSLIHI